MSKKISRRVSGAVCDRCREEVSPSELVHYINGCIVCPECFDEFAFDYFEDCLVQVSQIPEILDRHRSNAKGDTE